MAIVSNVDTLFVSLAAQRNIPVLRAYLSRLQAEKAFQKQATVFLGHKATVNRKGKGLRWVRNVGLGFKTPTEAIKVSAYLQACARPSPGTYWFVCQATNS